MAKVSVLTVKEESLAGEIILQVTEENGDSHALARKHSLDADTKSQGVFLGFVPGDASAPRSRPRFSTRRPAKSSGLLPKTAIFA